MAKHKFGGKWTIEKLDILSSYLNFYVTALKNQKFEKIYIDAFAGTGKIEVGGLGEDAEVIKGSVRLALDATEKFDRYIFIEKKKSFAIELKNLIAQEYAEYKDKVEILNQDCNEALTEICTDIDWRYSRAVLFLDPYAAAVNWETLESIAKTKAIDVWYLFPFSAANRLMKKNGEIDESWQNKLNSLFGNSEWYEKFYIPNPQMNFFEDDTIIKNVSEDQLKEYICLRLKTLFSAVSSNPRILYNTKHSPLFLFCFAVSNDSPKAKGLALKVAKHILEME